MEYKEAIEWLYRQLPMFSRVGAAAYKPGLDTSLQLDEYFGHPHRKFKSIHVAGTNGKGSTSHLLASILQAQGYRVGLYTSPHLIDFRERMRVNGCMISEPEVACFVEQYRNSDYPGHPSFFELTMMMAFSFFARHHVQFAVVETGMGGRLDSTNIITPIACVITNISKDHTQFLGDTLTKIASEKAGIIKHGIPVVIGESCGEVRRVFADKAAEVGTDIRYADDLALYDGTIRCPLSGDYQQKNFNTVLATVKMLRENGIEISDRAVEEGFANVCDSTGFMGRWTKICEAPLTICDTGHNEAGLTSNMAQLEHLMSQRPGATLKMVMGFVADKDVEHILPLLPRRADYYVCQAGIPRAMSAEKLNGMMQAAGLQTKVFAAEHGSSTVAAAHSCAVAGSSSQDIVYIGGSTFVVADFLAAIKK